MENMVKNILVTGGTGFIGSHVIEKLIDYEYNVILLKRENSNTQRIDEFLSKIKTYDVDDIVTVFEKENIDCVIHVATYYVKEHKEDDIQKIIKSNIEFPTRILELMNEHDVKYFVNTGTFFEFDLTKKVDEKTPEKPYNMYAESKINFLRILKNYSEKFGIKYIDLKLFSPYGPKDNMKLVRLLIENTLNGKKIEITKGEQEWNWTYAKDIAQAYICAIKYIEKMESNGESFNIGTDKTVKIIDIVKEIENVSGKNGIIKPTREYPENELFFVNCDNKKAKDLLHWEPKYDIIRGIKETFDYYNNKK